MEYKFLKKMIKRQINVQMQLNLDKVSTENLKFLGMSDNLNEEFYII